MTSARSSATIGVGGGVGRLPSPSMGSRFAGSAWPYPLVVLIAIGVVWQTYATIVHSLLIPTFTGTMAGIVVLLLDPSVYAAFAVSNESLVIGFVGAVLIGIPLGLGVARFRTAEAFVDPYLSILLVVPVAGLIPIFIMSLGLGLTPRVLIVMVFSLPMIVVNCRAGVRQVDPGLIEMASSYGASERQIWRRVLVPGALPAIMAGVRIGLGRAVAGMVIVELLYVSVGIGGLVLYYEGAFEPDLLYATIVLVVLEALVLVSTVRWIERRVAPWAHETVLRK